MPGFWTVLKWAMAVVLAPIIVWLTIFLLLAAAVVINHEEPAPVKAAARRK